MTIFELPLATLLVMRRLYIDLLENNDRMRLLHTCVLHTSQHSLAVSDYTSHK